jgi:hypothetical protein
MTMVFNIISSAQQKLGTKRKAHRGRINAPFLAKDLGKTWPNHATPHRTMLLLDLAVRFFE